MILALLVVLAVSAALAFYVDQRTIVTDRLRLGIRGRDGVVFTPNQIENRRILRAVVWLWKTGHLPPMPMTLRERIVFGAANAVLISTIIGFVLAGLSGVVSWLL